jgi:hypothetical protein
MSMPSVNRSLSAPSALHSPAQTPDTRSRSPTGHRDDSPIRSRSPSDAQAGPRSSASTDALRTMLSPPSSSAAAPPLTAVPMKSAANFEGGVRIVQFARARGEAAQLGRAHSDSKLGAALSNAEAIKLGAALGNAQSRKDAVILTENQGIWSLRDPSGKESVPHGEYNYVRMMDGQTRIGHQVDGSNAHGQVAGQAMDIAYAGTVKFNQGKLEYFSNVSGTYQPPADLSHQAGFGKDAKFMNHKEYGAMKDAQLAARKDAVADLAQSMQTLQVTSGKDSPPKT